ncbi:MAG: hypothetical protein ACREDJ_08525, partial [Methylocella sp.]
MKKLAAFLVVGAVLAAGLPGQARAAESEKPEVATVNCNIIIPTQPVALSQASAGVTLPPSCAASATSSSLQCVADLLSKGFKLANSLSLTPAS